MAEILTRTPQAVLTTEKLAALLRLLQEISIAVAQAVTINAAYQDVLSLICRFIGWPLGHVYIWSPGADIFISGRIWHVSDPDAFLEFRELSQNTTFRPDEGTVGIVNQSKEPLAILDVYAEDRFVRRLPQNGEKLQAYFAFPIIVEEQVAAILEFFSNEPDMPGREITAIIQHAGALLGLAVRRQQTWRRLQQSESQLAEAQRTAHIGHWEWNVLLDEVTWSPEIYRIFGLSPDRFEPTLQGFLNSIHGEDRELVQKNVAAAYENGRPFNYFHRIIRPDGETRVVHARGRPVYDQAGNIIKLYGTLQDMTELKEAELKLEDTISQLQRRLSENDALAAITYALTESLELDELLHLIVTHIQNVVPHAEWTAIHLQRPKTYQLELVASAGLEINTGDYLIEAGKGLAGQVMAEGIVINVPDVQTDPRRLPVDLNINTRSLLVAPVESRYALLGTISVQCSTPASFTIEDERLLKLLGIQAGIAIENARLYIAQRRARKMAEMQRERIRNMARRLVKAQEEERGRIARELHDESGQTLTSLKISLSLLAAQLPEELPDIQAGFNDLQELVDNTINSLRLLSHNLRPPGLEVYGLNAALSGLCQDFEKHTSLKVIYSGTELPEVDDLFVLSLYRLAQEALTNIVKHAEATEARVTLEQDDMAIFLSIQDNGHGFIPPDFESNLPVNGAGLVGMMERIEMVNGSLEITSNPGQGSCIKAIIPTGSKNDTDSNR